MILTFGSSRRAASQSVVTSGSSVDVVMRLTSSQLSSCPAVCRASTSLHHCRMKDVDGRDIGERKRRRPSDGYARAMTANVDGHSLTLRLLRLEFLDRAAGVAPGGESAADMGDRL